MIQLMYKIKIKQWNTRVCVERASLCVCVCVYFYSVVDVVIEFC